MGRSSAAAFADRPALLGRSRFLNLRFFFSLCRAGCLTAPDQRRGFTGRRTLELSNGLQTQPWLRVDTTREKSWKDYKSKGFFDESITHKGNPRAAASRAINFLKSLSAPELAERRRAAELAVKEMGISFTVYSEGTNIDRA